jgi:O-6-methylguanine DNA methyltransferase
MKCQQIQNMLAELTLPRLQAGKYTVLHQHIQHCSPCQQVWKHWQHFEQHLADLLAVKPAPAGLWERIMTEVRIFETAEASPAIWRLFAMEVSPQGIQRLILHDSAQEVTAEGGGGNRGAMSSLAVRARMQLTEYFCGERAIFQLPVDLNQCSDFERTVLEATATIPYGEVRSYTWIAKHIGRPGATRAVGNALHKNPVPIVIPCHRVVKSDGSIGGYAFGEAWKTRLLTLERDTTPVVGCSSTRILCYRGCHHERRVRADNRIHFVDLSEALQSGYRPCTVCQPHESGHDSL